MNIFLISDDLDVVPEELLCLTVAPERREQTANRRLGRESFDCLGLVGPRLLDEHLLCNVPVERQVRKQSEKALRVLRQALHLVSAEFAAAVREDRADSKERHLEEDPPIADVLRSHHALADERGRDVPLLPLAGVRVHPSAPRRGKANTVTLVLDFRKRAAIDNAVFL